jgi:hypothetical protein
MPCPPPEESTIRCHALLPAARVPGSKKPRGAIPLVCARRHNHHALLLSILISMRRQARLRHASSRLRLRRRHPRGLLDHGLFYLLCSAASAGASAPIASSSITPLCACVVPR